MEGSSDSSIEAIATALVAQFDRMVRRDGGKVSLLGIRDDGLIETEYRPGVDETCDSDVCVMPHLELQELMAQTLRRRDPNLSVAVRLAS
jgi:Fe-S cluster biogenesis protein NfuA